jgi:hypothetical protein
MDIKSKPVQMQRVIEEDVLGTIGQGRRLPRTNGTRALVRQIASVKGKQHCLVMLDASVAICLIFPRVTLDPIMFHKHQLGPLRVPRRKGRSEFFVTEANEILPHKVHQIDV